MVCFLARIKLIAYLFCIRYLSKMRIVQIFMQLQEFLWVDFIFRHINSSKIYSGGFLSTWRPNRKSFENQAHFVSLSETSVLYFLCALTLSTGQLDGNRKPLLNQPNQKHRLLHVAQRNLEQLSRLQDSSARSFRNVWSIFKQR